MAAAGDWCSEAFSLMRTYGKQWPHHPSRLFAFHSEHPGGRKGFASEESIVQLRDDTATMLEQRVKPCEEKVDVLRADTKSMLEERLKPCEAHIRGLRGEQDALQGTLSGNTVQLEQLAARAQDLDQQCQWTNSVLEEESQRREAVEEAVGATWMNCLLYTSDAADE